MKSLQFLSLLHLVARSTNTFQTDSTTTPSHDLLCYYDPFYHLRLDGPPICSLSPKASSADPTPEILSFEEWKAARQIAAESLHKLHSDTDNAAQHPNKSTSDEDERAAASSFLDGSQSSGEDNSRGSVVQGDNNERVRVPLTDRFNYASQDCTARIHSSHKGGKSPSAILSSKKDRYMLSPCNSKHKFVVVELCDDIRIDTVQLGNFEFFSGVFKDVKISLAESAPGDPLSWVDAGTYRAKNIRAVQSFHPQQGRQKFWRYIRIDFLSHYGNEYYCPVTLLRVYGLTHMEDYKWVGWQTDKEAAMEAHTNQPEEAIASITIQTQDIPSTQALDPESQPFIPNVASSSSSQHVPTPTLMSHTDFGVAGDPTQPAHSLNRAVPSPTEVPDSRSGVIYPVEESRSGGVMGPMNRPHTLLLDASRKPVYSSGGQTYPSVQDATAGDRVGSGGSASSTTSTVVASTYDTPPARPSSTISSYSSSTVSSAASNSLPSSAIASAPTPGFHTGGGESIYRTIMNKLHVLEMNSTLGIRYVEEQTRSIRDVVRKLEEDVGRLDELGKRQQRLFERAILEMEKQRRESDSEIRKLATDVQTLAREVALEKRLGFLQLCLLICAFIFMGLTRGSRDQNFAPQAAVGSTVRSSDWARGRGHKESQDLGRPPRRYSGLGPKTSPKSQISFHAKRPSVGDPFAMPAALDDSGASTSYRFPPSQAHAQHASLTRLNRHVRQRVISSPSLPIQLRHSSPRRIAPHLHEVKATEPSRRRFQIDLGEEDDEGGTPRVQRTLPFQGHVIPFPSGLAKGKEPSASQEEREERETSPSSTAAGDEISSDEAGVWEDTSTEGGDDEGLSLDPSVPNEAATRAPFNPTPLPVGCEPSQSVETLRLGQV